MTASIVLPSLYAGIRKLTFTPRQRLGRVGPRFPGEDRSPPRLIVAIPRDGALQALFEPGPRGPAEQPLGLLGRADVAVDLAQPLGDVTDEMRRLAEGLEHERGDVGDGDVDAGRDVQHLAGDRLDRRVDHG